MAGLDMEGMLRIVGSPRTMAVLAGLVVAWLVLIFVGFGQARSRHHRKSSLVDHLRAMALRPFSWNHRLRLEKRLIHAGRGDRQVADLVLYYVAAAVLMGAVGFVLASSLPLCILASVLGAGGVELWVRQCQASYRAAIARQLPSFLDLLCLCLGAGMSFNAALMVVMRYTHDGALKTLWNGWLFDVRSGCTRVDALTRLMQKSDEPGLQRLCIAMIQAEKTGAALVQSLNAQSRLLRQEQLVSAERRAAQAPMKMLLPLIVCFFPSTFMVLAFSIWVGVSEIL